MKRDEYLKMFAGGERQKFALERAHDIRKFEIDLYWKRASYFWTIIAAALAGFFLLGNHGPTLYAYVVCCLGLLFSLGWYAVNRGGSTWQRNWETHVDLLEDEITGPLHKTFAGKRSYSFWDLSGPYAFSPSRVNTILSIIVVCVWVLLAVDQLLKILPGVEATQAKVLTVGSVLAAVSLIGWGRPGQRMMTVEPTVRTRRYL